ncbi:2-dehydro-3-deoxy-phosphogluconate aldolase [Cytobacillus praedii]|uniref:2-dehydro-3-deoxy-phosphogluconate aldolase n=1 Tax=Cytobacillus praedii TaxID=1742358 RepID=UPI002E20E8A2|nr:KDGP aldolase [Cytobacillus praedii]
MTIIDNRFYKGRVSLNVLANSIQNAKNIFQEMDGHVLIGMTASNFPSAESAAKVIEEYGKEIDHAISIGLGNGDNRQAKVVATIAKLYPVTHINQVFPYVGITRANLEEKNSWINSLVSPTGKAGFVNISTGPISSTNKEKAIVPIKAAISLVRDMGGNALKYFPMDGLSCEEEFRMVAQACGEEGFSLEPTGGLNKENFESILRIALEANVRQVIPHVYSSIINRESGGTNLDDIRELYKIMKRLVEEYE